MCLSWRCTALVIKWPVLDAPLHQATEYIVNCALALEKPFAVAPCCVFAREFPHRRLYSGGSTQEEGNDVGKSRAVVVFEDFVEYLRRLPARSGRPKAERVFLPYDGKNCVVFAR